VTLVESNGATIRVDGTAVIGHLHISQISHERIPSIDTLLREGDSLKAVVLKVDKEKRLSLSTKALEPTPGDMLKDKQLVFDKAEETAEAWMQERTRMDAQKAAEQEAARAEQLARMNALAIKVRWRACIL
jgi:small subunit ribosomal protein S1